MEISQYNNMDRVWVSSKHGRQFIYFCGFSGTRNAQMGTHNGSLGTHKDYQGTENGTDRLGNPKRFDSV